MFGGIFIILVRLFERVNICCTESQTLLDTKQQLFDLRLKTVQYYVVYSSWSSGFCTKYSTGVNRKNIIQHMLY